MEHEIKVVEFDEKCPSCKGTGLYVGMAERDGAAVVCHTCKGTGCHHFKHEYEVFEGREKKEGIEQVIQTNGGMSYEDWVRGKPFTAGMEMRLFTCPCWWYQLIDYKKKPDWQECEDSLGSSFSRCPHFVNKEECWKRWDDEQVQRRA